MSAIDRLYSINNKTVKKSINIDDSLYKRLMRYTKKNYDATISDMINVCIEDLLSTGSVKYYAKPEDEITIYRSVMIRKENEEALNKITQETGISLTRLVNIAMKEFLEKFKERWDGDVERYAAMYYTAAYLVADAINRANSDDPEKVRQALSETSDFQAIFGNLTCSEQGELNTNLYILEFDGEKRMSIAK